MIAGTFKVSVWILIPAAVFDTGDVFVLEVGEGKEITEDASIVQAGEAMDREP